RIDAADLRLQRCRRPPPPIDQLHADLGKLLVPGTELRGRVGATALEHGIPAREDLPEAAQRSTMTGVEPGGDAVDEIATQGGRTIEHFHVVPAERHRARPRTAGAFTTPGAVLETFERAPDGDRSVEPTQLTRDGHAGRAPVGYFGQTRRSERATSEQ